MRRRWRVRRRRGLAGRGSGSDGRDARRFVATGDCSRKTQCVATRVVTHFFINHTLPAYLTHFLASITGVFDTAQDRTCPEMQSLRRLGPDRNTTHSNISAISLLNCRDK